MKALTVADLIKSLSLLPPSTPVMDSSWAGLIPMYDWLPFFVGKNKEGVTCLFVDSGEASTCSILGWTELAVVP